MKNLKRFLAMALAITLLFCNPQLAFASEQTPEQNIAAQWVANTVKITFNSNGGGVAPGVQVYTYGAERSLPGACAMKKTGYVFAGWSLSNSATTPDWEPGATSTTAFGYADETKAIAKTLYAVWKSDTTVADTLNSITSFLGVLNKSTTPTSTQYAEASLVEKVNYLESELATTKSDIATIKTAVSSLESSGNSIIKSIQRGVSNVPLNSNYKTISINNIDPSKSIVILNHGSYNDNGVSTYQHNVGVYSGTLFADNFTVWKYSGGSRVDFSWQVIEFY